MDINTFKKQITETVVKSMQDFISDGSEDYTQEDIDACRTLLEAYLQELDALKKPTDEDIMSCVEKVVLALNDLNEKTDYVLIETGEREAICEIIQEAAIACGLGDIPDDVTEEWREW